MTDILRKIGRFWLGDAAPKLPPREIFFSALGAGLGMVAVAWVSRFYIGDASLFLVASMGAATVLFYAAPHSPLAQPWPFVGGHLVSATVGVTCAYLLDDLALAAALAISLAILSMLLLRCLHPPGGAVALLAVLGGDSVRDLGYQFVLMPVAVNVALMLATVLVVVNLTPGRRYPVGLAVPTKQQQADLDITASAFDQEDLKAALAQMKTYIDISQGDLSKIYALAALESKKRRMGFIHCRDIMTHPVLSAEFGTPLGEAWALMHKHKIKSLPVVDRAKRVVGIVTVNDFVKEAHGFSGDGAIHERLMQLIKRTTALTSDKAEVVGQVMTSPAMTVSEETHILSLVPIFAERGIHHLPVVNDEKRLIGMITRYDVMQALHDHEGLR